MPLPPLIVIDIAAGLPVEEVCERQQAGQRFVGAQGPQHAGTGDVVVRTHAIYAQYRCSRVGFRCGPQRPDQRLRASARAERVLKRRARLPKLLPELLCQRACHEPAKDIPNHERPHSARRLSQRNHPAESECARDLSLHVSDGESASDAAEELG